MTLEVWEVEHSYKEISTYIGNKRKYLGPNLHYLQQSPNRVIDAKYQAAVSSQAQVPAGWLCQGMI